MTRLTIAFHSNQLQIRGTEVALYDYALHNEAVLTRNSVIAYNADSPHTTPRPWRNSAPVSKSWVVAARPGATPCRVATRRT